MVPIAVIASVFEPCWNTPARQQYNVLQKLIGRPCASRQRQSNIRPRWFGLLVRRMKRYRRCCLSV